MRSLSCLLYTSVKGSAHRGRFAFEEAAYLLLFGELPTACLLYTSFQ